MDFGATKKATSPRTSLLRDHRPSQLPPSPLFHPSIDTNWPVFLPSCLPRRRRAALNLQSYPSPRTPSALIRLTAWFRRVSVPVLSDCARFPQLLVSRRGDGAIGSSSNTPLPRPVGVDCWIVGAVFLLPHRRFRVAVVFTRCVLVRTW